MGVCCTDCALALVRGTAGILELGLLVYVWGGEDIRVLVVEDTGRGTVHYEGRGRGGTHFWLSELG
jgi:hypothetical protein